MSPRRPTRQPVRTAARTLRALLLGGLLASVLAGGDCHWAFSSKTSDDDDGGGTTVIVTDDTVGEWPPEPVGEEALGPELLVLEDVYVQFASREELAAYRAAGGTAQPPLFQRAVPSEQPAFLGLSPARIWPVERIGETELAAFAAGLLAANEEVLALPVAAAALRYLDTQVVDGIASVRLGEGAADRAEGGLVVAVRFGPSGELLGIERVPLLREIGEWPGDRIPDPR